MKEFGPAYQWEDSDGKVTVQGIYRLRGKFVREWVAKFGMDPDKTHPVLILSHKQRADLWMDTEIHRHCTPRSPAMRLTMVAGFKIVVNEVER